MTSCRPVLNRFWVAVKHGPWAGTWQRVQILSLVPLLLLAVVLVLGTGCQTYNERFTYLQPETGQTNHVVHVSYRSFLMWGEAAQLRTETQTQEFIRSVNATGLKVGAEKEVINAITEGVSSAVLKSINPVP